MSLSIQQQRLASRKLESTQTAIQVRGGADRPSVRGFPAMTCANRPAGWAPRIQVDARSDPQIGSPKATVPATWQATTGARTHDRRFPTAISPRARPLRDHYVFDVFYVSSRPIPVVLWLLEVRSFVHRATTTYLTHSTYYRPGSSCPVGPLPWSRAPPPSPPAPPILDMIPPCVAARPPR
jgi:hypothetical protein